MLKHVLVPLDGSKLAEEALEHAIGILAPQGKISLISAVEIPEIPKYGYFTPVTLPDYENSKSQLLPLAKQYLEGIVKDFGNADVTFDFSAAIGDPARLIIETANWLHVDAIVMSTHGRSGISQLLFGSVTNKVLAAKICPVFVVFNKEVVPLENATRTVEYVN